ncbi:AsmA family protein, partial [Pseudomonas syringae pv. actinidiae]|nr:AsmA family protein [Pseudomonas syringae pv. actinidiae]
LTLHRDENGHGNWEDIGKPAVATTGTPGEATPAPAPDAAKPDRPSQPIRLDIDSLTVNNARVDYSDARKGRTFTAESIQLSTGPIREASDIPIKLTAFLSTNQPVVRTKTELVGQLRMDRVLKRYQFEDMRLSGEVAGEPLQGKLVTFSAQANCWWTSPRTSPNGTVSKSRPTNCARWANCVLATWTKPRRSAAACP